MTSEAVYTGGCYCGQNRYEVKSAAKSMTLCHCTTCRHLSGSFSLPFMQLVRDDFSWTKKEGNSLKELELSPGNIRTFCSACGTPITMTYHRGPTTISVAVGTVDDKFEKELVDPLVTRSGGSAPSHIFIEQQPPWADLHTWEHDVRKYERFAPGDPVAVDEQGFGM